MFVIPSIDIKEGKVVRIYKGDPDKEIIAIDNPQSIAEIWKGKGARFLHIVDLDAVFGKQNQIELIKKILAVGVPSTVGGGIRNFEIAKRYIDLGAYAVVVSTMVIEAPAEFQRLIETFPNKVVLALDFDEDFRLATKGWKERSKSIFDFLSAQYLSIRGFLFTAIFKDGTGEGIPKFHFKKISQEFSFKGKINIAAGGINSVEELYFLKELGFWGAVVGRAFYEGKINLFEC